MLSSRPVAPKTPHTKLRNENQLAPHSRAFPKTPLPKELLNTVHTSKQAIEVTIQPRKALFDKTPGTHLQNRGNKVTLQDPNGKTFTTLDEKPPSASRKSTKKPRLSADFKTPDPATRKPYWDVSETSIVEQAQVDPVQEEEEGDFDEPEYMPPTAEVRPIEEEYDLPTGEELGQKLLEIARKPWHCYYNDSPPSFEYSAFFIPEDQLIIPLRPLSPSSDEEEVSQPVAESTIPAQASRSTRSRTRTPAPAAVPTRTSSRLAQATKSSQAKAAATTVARMATTTRGGNKKKENLVPATTSQVAKGKGKGKAVEVEEELLDCPPELLEMFKQSELVYEDFTLRLSDDDL